jgi:hypothetical protein
VEPAARDTHSALPLIFNSCHSRRLEFLSGATGDRSRRHALKSPQLF